MIWGRDAQRLAAAEASLAVLREGLLAVTRELGAAQAEAARWEGMYHVLEAQAALRRAFPEPPGPPETILEQTQADVDAMDAGELRRIRAAMEADPLGTLLREGGGALSGLELVEDTPARE